ncbi:MAG: NADH-quinone oxidoreductase subunit L [Candidatus Eremiobacteraeota bacterium]|nr:NADH-quinone oxidoreductase subunit L [Candidatus Eremiobacteraeota bacterium]
MLYTIWLLPLLGAVVLWVLGPQLRERGGILGSAAVGLSFFATLTLYRAAGTTPGVHVPLGSWIGGFTFGLMMDPLSLIWVLVITGVGGLIHVYSIGYMAGDRAVARFFAYMNFFVFAMLTLVLSDNFVGLLVGWGLVGLASYFLIGFWFERPSAVAAARKAFVINVVGDVGLMFAVFVLFSHTGSIAYTDVFARVRDLAPPVLLTACIAIFIGCAAKSAQVPLHTWLPDALEGPTPVSALIHAATMVTAGVYLVARCAPLWDSSSAARELVGTIGAVTALAGAILGIAQWDIKRVLAYSTMSQIGYMIMGVGVGAYEAGVLHFFTHAFFKAQLFLAAGLAIHALAGEQDIRNMGGLARRMPFAFWGMLIGTLSICGVPFFAGFYSKDAVIYGELLDGHPWLYVLGVATAGITAYYMFRMLFIAFFGRDRTQTEHHGEPAHASNVPDWVMQVPVAILMVGTIAAGYLDIGGDNSIWSRFLAPDFAGENLLRTGAPQISDMVSSAVVLVAVVLGFGLAYLRYGAPAALTNAPERLDREARTMPPVLTHGYFVDDLIWALFVRPAQALGMAFGRFLDPVLIDGAVRDTSFLAGVLGWITRRLENGLVRAYAVTIVLGVACFVAYYAFAGIPR